MIKDARKKGPSTVDKASVSPWDEKFKTQLAERWPEFVNCRKRLKTEGPFLLSINRPGTMRILDAAMGIGCEAVFLAKQGFYVTGNEIDHELSRHANQLANQESVTLQFTNYDWRELRKHFGAAQFDLTLVLGNSLCLLRQKYSRLETAENLRAVCKAGGAVVVDERNFDYILRERKEILRGSFRYTGRMMYCGTSIRGRPVFIEDHHVRFAYEDVCDGTTLGYLDMHPFRKGEIVELFFRAGFTKVEVFSDFQTGYRDNADFFTYVFR